VRPSSRPGHCSHKAERLSHPPDGLARIPQTLKSPLWPCVTLITGIGHGRLYSGVDGCQVEAIMEAIMSFIAEQIILRIDRILFATDFSLAAEEAAA
jgi:hypothetical protein